MLLLLLLLLHIYINWFIGASLYYEEWVAAAAACGVGRRVCRRRWEDNSARTDALGQRGAETTDGGLKLRSAFNPAINSIRPITIIHDDDDDAASRQPPPQSLTHSRALRVE
eukprot:GHVU01026356.1.p1 GENE.GHVU01026356.1~~GHVU01026356.1.p1  ORF type:complete len:112 (-),score=21.56 GHVU01026356.1:320-655(-)